MYYLYPRHLTSLCPLKGANLILYVVDIGVGHYVWSTERCRRGGGGGGSKSFHQNIVKRENINRRCWGFQKRPWKTLCCVCQTGGIINVFSKRWRATGLHRRAKQFELSLVIRKSMLWKVKPGIQNHPHSRST